MTDDSNLKTVPLDALHRQLGAKMVPFAGHAMPLQYKGILAEHNHTRTKASLFDVSHMGQASLKGDGAAEALETLVPGELVGLPVGAMRYTQLTNDQGGIIDDLMVTKRRLDLFLVVNASRKDVDLAHIRDRLAGRATLEELSDRALLALQGPAAAEVLTRLSPPVRHMDFMARETLTIADARCVVTRSGYTGEDGFEISVPAEAAEHLAALLLEEPEVEPAGLGARDSLRLEAGLCLYGSDIDETTTPVEAGLLWSIGKRRRTQGGFPGAAVIQRQIAEGPPRRRVGLRPDGKAPARAHTEITTPDGTPIGEVTSGGFGPTVGGPVAMGYVSADQAAPGTRVHLMVRGKALPAEVVKMPFTPHRYHRG
ncbi:MAG: glycine cleavage system aminomethyltransferase GcvT [Rhodobacterales bacterium]|nr:glycine cleavage system aminomethyltransferase GcvT [Rhodobacterales bacterium]